MHWFISLQACDDQDHAHTQVCVHCEDASQCGAWNPRIQLTPGTTHTTAHTHIHTQKEANTQEEKHMLIIFRFKILTLGFP